MEGVVESEYQSMLDYEVINNIKKADAGIWVDTHPTRILYEIESGVMISLSSQQYCMETFTII